jgi:hypothetical protein
VAGVLGACVVLHVDDMSEEAAVELMHEALRVLLTGDQLVLVRMFLSL